MLCSGCDEGPPDVSYEYEGFTPGSVMAQIRDMDPDGGQAEPGAADYAAFRERVTAQFGAQALHQYEHYHDPEMGQ